MSTSAQEIKLSKKRRLSSSDDSKAKDPRQTHEKSSEQRQPNGKPFRRPAIKEDREHIQKARRELPIFKAKSQILEALKSNDTLVLVGETGQTKGFSKDGFECWNKNNGSAAPPTGSGKSTQLPQFLHEAGYCRSGAVAITQPRRVAATTVAGRVAFEMGVPLGADVGYSVRRPAQRAEVGAVRRRGGHAMPSSSSQPSPPPRPERHAGFFRRPDHGSEAAPDRIRTGPGRTGPVHTREPGRGQPGASGFRRGRGRGGGGAAGPLRRQDVAQDGHQVSDRRHAGPIPPVLEHTRARTHTRTRTRTRTHAHARAHARRAHACTRAHLHLHLRAPARAHAYAGICAHARQHAQVRELMLDPARGSG